MVDKKLLIRRSLFVAYGAAIFLFFLFLLFPTDRIKARLQTEVHQRTPFELSIGRISPGFFNSIVLMDMVVSDRNGKVLFESPSAKTSVSLFGLFRGLLSLTMKIKAYSGELLVKVQEGPGRHSFQLDVSSLDVSLYSLLKDWGIHLSGKLGGNLEMTGDIGKARFWLHGLASRELKVKGFSIPDLDFEQSWFEADIKGDRMTIKKLELEGKELKIQCQGDLVLSERGSLNITVRFKPSERIAREQAGILALIKNRDADGFYQFILGGTLDAPVPRL